MKIKRAIRYLRISNDKQSNFSITGQDDQTNHWCHQQNIEVVDTFVDDGYSARTFDRPDMIRLNAFIQQHYRTVDYLVVNDLTRFSRDAGEALVQVKKLQREYSIKIVSISENLIVDYDDPGSFFYAGLRFLQGEDEIIRNRSRINLGIYTAKKKEGRYLGNPPIGYKTTRDGRKQAIVVDEEKAPIIRYIYEAFLSDTPIYLIARKAREMGFRQTAKMAIQNVLKNPVYTSLLPVKAFKDNPAELVEAIHEPIISRYDWQRVQEKMKPGKPVQLVSDAFPLRHALLCHCGKPLTGAPSRSKSGKYYPYYKCKVTGHNNFNADRAHRQIEEVFDYLSLSQHVVIAHKDACETVLEQQMKAAATALRQHRNELESAEKKLKSVEEKWIMNQLTFESYQRWYSDLSTQRMQLKAQIEKLSQNQGEAWMLLQNELYKLTDMKGVYTGSSTLQKQQLIKLVFDSQLYYKENIYRTPYIIPVFAHNKLILKEKQLLVVEEKTGISKKSLLSAPQGAAIEPLTDFLALLSQIRVA